MKIRVITWNIGGEDPGTGTPDQIAAALAAQHADIILLQEVKVPLIGDSIVARIASATGLNAHFVQTAPQGPFKSKGMAIFSRWDMGNFHDDGTGSPFVGGFRIMSADVAVNVGGVIRVMNTRWDVSHMDVMNHLKDVTLDYVNRTPEPPYTITRGFQLRARPTGYSRAAPRSAFARRSASAAKDFFQKVGSRLHYLADSRGWNDRIQAIDHTFGGGNVGLLATQDIDTGLSDHGMRVSDLLYSAWQRIGHANSVVSMATSNNELFAVTPDNRLWTRHPNGSNMDWRDIGHANNVVAIVGTHQKLYAATSDNKLWWRDPRGVNVDWQEIGTTPGVTAMGAAGEDLYAATTTNRLISRKASDVGASWTDIGHAIGVISISGLAGKLYCLTGDGRIWWRDAVLRDVDWFEIGVAPEPSSAITVRDHMWLASKSNGLWWREIN